MTFQEFCDAVWNLNHNPYLTYEERLELVRVTNAQVTAPLRRRRTNENHTDTANP